MTLFDNEFNGKYETDHIHMVLEEDVPLNLDGLSYDWKYSLFVHEYVHYFQHFGTLYGSKYYKMQNILFIATRLYLDKHKDINLPFGIWEHDDNILKYKNRTQALAGSKKCSHSIDEIEISGKEIEKASFEKKQFRLAFMTSMLMTLSKKGSFLDIIV